MLLTACALITVAVCAVIALVYQHETEPFAQAENSCRQLAPNGVHSAERHCCLNRATNTNYFDVGKPWPQAVPLLLAVALGGLIAHRRQTPHKSNALPRDN